VSPSPDFARSFGRAAEEYERGRSGYPEEALDFAGVPADAVVLDLAAGTGKLTRQLVRRHARVIAVEPTDRMRAILERVVPEAEALAGVAEAIPLPDDSVDAVYVGEAFHWFGEAAVDEVARVLRPGGSLVILFNRSDGEVEPALPRAFDEALEAGSLKKPDDQTIGSGAWQRAFPGPFGPFTTASFSHRVERDRDGLIDLLASQSVVAALPDVRRERLVETLRSLAPEGSYVSPLRLDVYVARLGYDR